MATAEQFVKQIFSWITQGENYADKLKILAGRLESEREGTNIQSVVASVAKLALLYQGVTAACLFSPELGSPAAAADAGACDGTNETEECYSDNILTEARGILNRSNETVRSIKKLFEELKNENQDSNPDPEFLHRLILADVLVAVGKHRQLDMSNIDQLPEKLIECLPELGFSHILTSFCDVLLIFDLETGSESLQNQAKSRPMTASGGIMLVGAATAHFNPEAVDSWRDLINNNCVTEASQSLRSRAEEILKITRELKKQFNIIKESLKYLSRIKYIIENKNRNPYEKKELINYAIKYSRDKEVKQWLSENAESDVFFHLVNLAYFIQQNLRGEVAEEEAAEEEEDEVKVQVKEEKKRKKKDRKRQNIELIFLAHGSIENRMIPATCLLPLTSITDVLLYSPWNCFLSTTAAYSIAIGSIRPDDRQFVCSPPIDPKTGRPPIDPNTGLPIVCSFPLEAHTPSNLPSGWNYMRKTGDQNVPRLMGHEPRDHVPRIMVSPVGTPDDEAFVHFITLEIYFGAPAANRYLIPYLASWIGEVPFFVVTLAISLVLSFSNYEATVHLAACLGKSPRDAVMQEKDLMEQYAYTVDNTRMTVPIKTILTRVHPVFDMFTKVFGDESPSS